MKEINSHNIYTSVDDMLLLKIIIQKYQLNIHIFTSIHIPVPNKYTLHIPEIPKIQYKYCLYILIMICLSYIYLKYSKYFRNTFYKYPKYDRSTSWHIIVLYFLWLKQVSFTYYIYDDQFAVFSLCVLCIFRGI